MSGSPATTLACCGLLGTSVDDGGILERAFSEACATQGIVPGTAAYAHFMVGVHQSRGQAAVDVFRGLFTEGQGRAEAAALSFDRSFRSSVERTGLRAVPGAEQVFSQLHDAGVRVCLITGLSRRLLSVVLDSLGWWRLVDLALCPEDVPRGSPWPDLMLSAMLRLGVEDVREACFAGGTASGMLSARRSGAGIVAGVLAGGHTAERLRASGATHLIEELSDLPALLLGTAPIPKIAEAPVPPAPRASAPSRAAVPSRVGSAPRVPLERGDWGL